MKPVINAPLLAGIGGLLGLLAAAGLVVGAVGVLAGPISASIQAAGAIPPCDSCNVIVVSKDPATGNFTTVEEAVAHAATKSPTEASPWLIYVGPGIYDLAADGTNEPLLLPGDVHIQGAGERTTIITRGGGPTSPSTGNDSVTVVAIGRSGLSFLAVKNTGGDDYATGISQLAGAGHELRLDHVTVQVAGAVGANVAVLNNGAQLLIRDSTVVASGGEDSAGAFSFGVGAQIEILRSAVIGHGGSSNSYGILSLGDVSVGHSRITGGTASIWSTGVVDASYTLLAGGPVFSNTDACAAVYDEFNTFYTGTACP